MPIGGGGRWAGEQEEVNSGSKGRFTQERAESQGCVWEGGREGSVCVSIYIHTDARGYIHICVMQAFKTADSDVSLPAVVVNDSMQRF